MQIFKTIAKSVYGPGFYAKINKRSFGQSFGYTLFITLLAFLLGALILGVQFAKEVSFRPEQIEETIHSLYPDELELTIENGLLSSNVQEPYFVPAGESLDFLQMDPEFNLLVVDTETAFTAEQFYDYQTLAWLSLDSLHIMDDTNLQTIPLATEETLTINEEKVRQVAGTVSGFVLPILIGFLVFGAVFGVFFITLGRLFLNLFFALIVMLAAKAKKLNWDYGTSYIASLHVFTLATLVAPIQFLLPNDVQIPFLRLGLFVFVLALNLSQVKR